MALPKAVSGKIRGYRRSVPSCGHTEMDAAALCRLEDAVRRELPDLA